ncbi:phosphate ABC transporter substrate-binding protein [Flavobacterium album]|uniref:Phosphate ABC transporter substrate-binding protein n=1 Tax=Flavobacterium album TaxID=2175091 RepID=A0A2S1QU53_9FLAO|nr:substrate-binding domain-containing protein [Flavobacterium album]AWH83915.1 phosphate ABC transporter substrate-binding protein [Flavobacterium album]
MNRNRKLKYTSGIIFTGVIIATLVFACKKGNGKEGFEGESLTYGKATILVDNTVQPIVEDVLAVFHNVYDQAHIHQVNLTENEILQELQRDTCKIAVMPRKLTAEEEAHFRRKNITPRITEFAVDAIALITNSKATDTILNLREVYSVLQGKPSVKVPKLVFDNPNSSTVKELMRLAGVKSMPTSNVYALKSNEEVIKFVHDNPGSIGIVGVNWLVQPPPALLKYVEDIRILALDNVKIDKGEKEYYKPSQSNIATGSYPLTRKLYVLNYQGKKGLGMGFATYISAPEGQRIILKSGLLPVTIPTREVEVQ